MVMGVRSLTYRKVLIKELEERFQLELVPEKRYFRRKNKDALRRARISGIELLKSDTLDRAEAVTSVLAKSSKRAPAIKVPEDIYDDMTHFWFPEDRRFLRGLSEYVVRRLIRAPEPGRLGKLSKAISSIPDQNIRSAVQHCIAEEFGLELKDDGSMHLLDGRIDPATIPETIHDKLAAVMNRTSVRSILLNAAKVPANDFAHAVADIITENRSTFSEDDLAIMAEVIVLAANRARNSKNL